ncbi:MAG: capsular polysaccharide synthesis protein [Alloalcanivorax venustensis]|uniref:capsular polysaccharide synthesis protein n=1 Tax=Alloalcanivorax venustensis TaxID=172371 RepID=UPI003002E2DF
MEVNNLFVFWTGSNQIPDIRRRAIDSMSDTGLSVKLVTADNLAEYMDLDKIHPAYQNLNLAHRADYLRAYFMHHFGGGYADVKTIRESYLPMVKKLNSSDAYWAAGYKEVSRHGVANIYQSSLHMGDAFHERFYSYLKWRWLQLNYWRVIGNCAFIFKPGTDLTRRWWLEVNRRLDILQEDLEKHPAIYPKERGGVVYNGSLSRYPVPWSYILGDVLQLVVLRYSSRVLKDLPPPDFYEYQ